MHRKYVDFVLAPRDISAIRFGISPGHELCHSVRALASPADHPLQITWLRHAARRIPREAHDLLTLLVGESGYIVDFLTSTPEWSLSPEEELARLRRADLAAMRVDLLKRVDRTTGAQQEALRALANDPAKARKLTAQAWQAVWNALLEPQWRQLERLLRADIAVRMRQTMTSGIGAMIDALHSRVSWEHDAVRVELEKHSEIVDCAGSGLVLVPSVTARRCMVVTERPAQPALFYPALGVSETWSREIADATTALSRLLGEGRARVLLALDEPLSTTAVAAASRVAISTASHHLAVLRSSQLIASQRSGAAVVHARTPLGEALVSGGGAPA